MKQSALLVQWCFVNVQWCLINIVLIKVQFVLSLSVYTYFSPPLVYADSGYAFPCDITLYYLLIAYTSSNTDLTMIREDTMMDIVD